MEVYEWKIYNTATNKIQEGARKGTLQAIASSKGTPLLETKEDVPADVLDDNGFMIEQSSSTT